MYSILLCRTESDLKSMDKSHSSSLYLWDYMFYVGVSYFCDKVRSVVDSGTLHVTKICTMNPEYTDCVY